jgi:hypothetical protein
MSNLRRQVTLCQLRPIGGPKLMLELACGTRHNGYVVATIATL